VYKGYEVAKEFDPFKVDLTQKLQKVRHVLDLLLCKLVVMLKLICCLVIPNICNLALISLSLV